MKTLCATAQPDEVPARYVPPVDDGPLVTTAPGAGDPLARWIAETGATATRPTGRRDGAR